MGDAVYERIVREKILLCANTAVNKLHNQSVKYVCCEFQAKAFDKIKDFLSEDEMAIFKRGKNATGVNPPKHSTILEYRMATALECLFGWLELMGEFERQKQIFDLIWEDSDEG